MNALRIGIATLFGLGRFPIASGTVGSAVTLPLALVLAWRGGWVYAIATAGIIAAGIWAADAAEGRFGLKDPHEVIIDEVAGQLVALFLIPVGAAWYAAGFLLFRLFDIVKPPPARQLERLPGGMGIVLDDLAAGLYANLLLHAARAVLARGALS